MKAKTLKYASAHDRQVHFNWGFHDATFDGEFRQGFRTAGAKVQPLPAFDPLYCAGYAAGRKHWEENQFRPASSQEAYDAYRASEKEKAAERKRIREMRPSVYQVA